MAHMFDFLLGFTMFAAVPVLEISLRHDRQRRADRKFVKEHRAW